MTNSVVVLAQSSAQGERLLADITDAGYQGVCVDNAAQAIEQLRSREAGLCLAHAAFAQALLSGSKAAAPLTPVVVYDNTASIERAVAAMRHGAADYVGDPTAAANKIREHFLAPTGDAVIQASANARRSFELAARVAQTDVSVLILGESGTGKEVVARFIHRCSKRARQPYVAINCAAIPDNMLEAMLFGHVKGAFTGAHQSQPGKFELAHGGTLLLDEISEMPLALQAKLLRALQEREVERVGGRNVIPVDVRVIATSNVDLKAAIAEGRFREDLFYRLSVFPLHLDPLRERTEDILALAEYFVAKHAAMQGRPSMAFTAAARDALCGHAWPGNVRELENTIQRALVLAPGSEIDAVDLGLSAELEMHDPALSVQLQGAEAKVILDGLRANGGRRKQTAQQLGISERTLRYKLQKLREAGLKEL